MDLIELITDWLIRIRYKLRSTIDIPLLYTKTTRNKMDNEQVATPASVESPSSTVEGNQPRNDSAGDDGLLYAGRYFFSSI